MKSVPKATLSLLATLLFTSTVHANYYPRASFWGLAGSENQGRLDALLPLTINQDSLLYADLQGDYAQHDGSSAGIGAGFRKLYNNSSIYGGYLFIDRDETTHHNEFTILSPGAEAIFPDWDFRLNGYFPINQRSKTISYFPSQDGDCRFVVFRGHQQFENHFSILEKAGPGGDAQIGYTIHQLHDTQLHAGIYYFNFNGTTNDLGRQSTKNITGIEGRIEIPVNYHWAVTVDSSYDQYAHGTILAGLRLNLGGATSSGYCDMRSHMVDPITRNIGALSTGSGIPTVTSKRNDGPVLTRDNIYFFTSQGGNVFVDNNQSGTFENPLRNDQLSQSVLNQIGNNANLYLNSGTYTIMGAGTAPNAEINIPFGDSIYGRSLNFKCPAVGNDRPTLLGGINLFAGNNTLDSIQLLNSITSDGTANINLIALNIQNASNIVLSNDVIKAIATVSDDLNADNFASGIYANNSQFLIKDSVISANAIVNQDINNGINAAAGMGANTNDTDISFTDNIITIVNSEISGFASVGRDININPFFFPPTANFASGIGSNTASGHTNFIDNEFTIINSNINGTAQVGRDNFLENFATGIGGNQGNFFPGGEASFMHNNFTIISSNITGDALVKRDNGALLGFNYAIAMGGNTANFIENDINISGSILKATATVNGMNDNENNAIGIGSNFGDFTDNKNIHIQYSDIRANATVGGDNIFNVAVAIGGNGGDFINNGIDILGSFFKGDAVVNGMNNSENYAIGMGGNFGEFTDNMISIQHSGINANAIVGKDNNSGATNFAAGLGGNSASSEGDFIHNNIAIRYSEITANASIHGTNNYENFATGIGSNNDPTSPGFGIFSQNNINISNSIINAVAIVDGDNSSGAINQARGINMNNDGVAADGNQVNIDQSLINVLAWVRGMNSGDNFATGLIASGAGDVINISKSIVNVLSLVSPGSSGTNEAAGTFTAAGGVVNADPITQFNVIESP